MGLITTHSKTRLSIMGLNKTLSITALSRIPLGITAFSIMGLIFKRCVQELGITAFSITTIITTTLCMTALRLLGLIMTISITKLSIMSHSITTLSITELSVMTLSNNT